eukprot:TRINITY_DN2563_c0_g1_i1.p1 TRINITY_DN2563_c0_g1~~TRINITY_DN2563_c0_g1_i1.p1  ORF type:complete len:168 (+),score=17.72 TRINITY_DN2563_c0_g1_i1:69-506(+)
MNHLRLLTSNQITHHRQQHRTPFNTTRKGKNIHFTRKSSMMEKGKKIWTEYKYIGLATYASLYFGGMGVCYLTLTMTPLSDTLVEWIANHMDYEVDASTGNFMMAVVLNEPLEVVRLPLAILISYMIKHRRFPTRESLRLDDNKD